MALQAAENTHVYLYRSLKAFKNGRQPAHRWHAAINVMASSQHCASRQPALCQQTASNLLAGSQRSNGEQPSQKSLEGFRSSDKMGEILRRSIGNLA
jgi:hypothetical protein